MAARKPRIFISSTISDFKDLRSALKYYLEEFGYKVLLSEFNDFEKPLDTSIIEACHTAIEVSDIFILLIGSKAGGLYSKKDKITITRNEYQYAYELFSKKLLKIVLFVREDIWKIKDDREALGQELNRKVIPLISKKKKQALKYHDGPVISNAELIFEFINEISKHKEFKEATSGKGKFPKGNWVHSFSSFENIIDVLDVQLKIRQDIGTVARKVNLSHELVRNINLNIIRIEDGNLIFKTWYTNKTREMVQDSEPQFIELPSEQVFRLINFSLVSNIGKEFSTQFIDSALESGDYLIFNKFNGQYKGSIIHKSLIGLKEQINTAKRLSTDSAIWFTEFSTKYLQEAKRREIVQIEMKLLIFLLALANAIDNITSLSISIYLALQGNFEYLEGVKVFPITPFPDQIEEIKKERFTIEEIQSILDGMV